MMDPHTITIQNYDFDLAKVAFQFALGQAEDERIHNPEIRQAEVDDFAFKLRERLYEEDEAAALVVGLGAVLKISRIKRGLDAPSSNSFDPVEDTADMFSKGLDQVMDTMRRELEMIENAIADNKEEFELPLTMSSYDLPDYLRSVADALIESPQKETFALRLDAFATDFEQKREAAVNSHNIEADEEDGSQ